MNILEPLQNKSLIFEQDTTSTASNTIGSLICPSVGSEDGSSIGNIVPETETVSHSTALFKWKEAVDSGAELSTSDVLPTTSDITTASTARGTRCKSMDTGISTDPEDDTTGVTLSSIRDSAFDISVVELEECKTENSKSQALQTSTEGEVTDCDDGSLDTNTDCVEQPQLVAPNSKENGSLVVESTMKMNMSAFLDINLSSSMKRTLQKKSDDMFTCICDTESVESRSEAGSQGECSCVDCIDCGSYSCENCQSGCSCSCSECNCSCSCEDCMSDYTCNRAITESDVEDNSSCTCSCEDCSTCCPSEIDSGRKKTTSNICSLLNELDRHDSSSDMDESTDSDCSCDYCVHELGVRDIVSVCTLGEDSDYDGDNEL